MDMFPTPIFDDQFEYRLPLKEDKIFPTITIEASRGCFYGKCSFCNLNCQWDNTYRQKSDEKVLKEIVALSDKQRTFRIMFCDTNVSNRIDLFEKIFKLNKQLDLILEVSGHADGRNRNFYEMIKKAGATQIQIGVEAFSNGLLRLIKKGVTVMKNVELLKWCAENNIRVFYNMLSHIPGEKAEDLQENVSNMDFLFYYEPPEKVCEFMLSHDSPAFEHPEKFFVNGFHLTHEIDVCFPKQISNDIAPLLTPIVGFPPDPTTPFQDWTPIYSKVEYWRKNFQANGNRAGMLYRDCHSFLTIEIIKFGVHDYVNLYDDYRLIYLSCLEEAKTKAEIKKITNLEGARIDNILNDLIANRLTYSDGQRYLSLAISSQIRSDFSYDRFS